MTPFGRCAQIRCLALAAIPLLASPAPSQAQQTPSFEQKYDRFDGYTTLTVDLGAIVRGAPHTVEMDLYQIWESKERKGSTDTVRLRLWSHSQEWVYLKFRAFSLLVDGKPMRLELTHNGDIGRNYVKERMHVDLSDEQFKKLTAATKIEAKLGLDEFTLNRDQLAALQEFAKLCADSDRPVPKGRFPAGPAAKKKARRK